MANDLSRRCPASFRRSGASSRARLLRDEARITADKITFRSSATPPSALTRVYAGAAGANPTVFCFDELWGYTSERSHRLWDELVPPPTRKHSVPPDDDVRRLRGRVRLLDALQARPQQQGGRDRSLRGPGMLMGWTSPHAPWQTESWRDQMRRPSATERLPADDREPVGLFRQLHLLAGGTLLDPGLRRSSPTRAAGLGRHRREREARQPRRSSADLRARARSRCAVAPHFPAVASRPAQLRGDHRGHDAGARRRFQVKLVLFDP